jgi:hypothetical protein
LLLVTQEQVCSRQTFGDVPSCHYHSTKRRPNKFHQVPLPAGWSLVLFNLFSFEDEDLAKIKKTILILSSLILIGWWYGLSADLGKIAVLGPDTTAILSFYNLLSPFVIYFLFRLAVTAWWTLPKLNLDFNKLSLNSDDIISNLNSELKKFNENTAFLRDQIEAAHDFSVQVKIDNLPALDEFLADAKKLASFEKTNSMDTGHLSDDAFEARNAQLGSGPIDFTLAA